MLMLAEALVPPIPSELVRPLAGFLAAERKLWLPPTIVESVTYVSGPYQRVRASLKSGKS